MILYIFLIGRQQGELKVYPIFLEGDTGLVNVTTQPAHDAPCMAPGYRTHLDKHVISQ
jgi:hypothetical protein